MMRRNGLWTPQVNSTLWTLKRFSSEAKQLSPGSAQRPSFLQKIRSGGLYAMEPKQQPGSFKRYMKMAHKQFPLVMGSCVFVGVYSLATLSIPHGMGVLLDHATKGEMPFDASLRLLGWFFVAAAANFGRLSLVGIAGETLINRLRARLYKSMLRQDSAFFDQASHRSGALSQRLTGDTSVIGASLTEGLSAGTKNVIQFIGSAGVMLWLSKELTGVVAVMVPLTVLSAAIFGKFIRKLQVRKSDTVAECGAISEERLTNVKTVKAFAREGSEEKFYESKLNNLYFVSKDMAVANAAYVGVLHLSGYLTLYSLLFAGSMLVASNNITAGTLFSFMLYATYAGIGLSGISGLMTDLNKGYGASLRIFEILDQAEKLKAEKVGTEGKKLSPFNGDVVFKNVSFAYPTRPEIPIYKSLDLHIVPGKCTAVVGSSGSGKSTLASLLLKFYEPNGGTISVDGSPIEDLDTHWLRTQCALVSQEPVLFSGTIAQNIAYGFPEHSWSGKIDQWSMTAIESAAEKANAKDFILALPGGFESQCGQGGKSLSGGQKQRIAIARALVRDPQILILDEATSALDAESEEVVQEAIDNLINQTKKTQVGVQAKSVLMFAHRLSMIRQADTIAVMHEGVVIDVGSFEHVVVNPIFRHLVGLPDLDGDTAHAAGKKIETESKQNAPGTEGVKDENAKPRAQ